MRPCGFLRGVSDFREMSVATNEIRETSLWERQGDKCHAANLLQGIVIEKVSYLGFKYGSDLI